LYNLLGGFLMTTRERVMAILHYENYDKMPVVHFGYWYETLHKWHAEGHITKEEAYNWWDGSPTDKTLEKKLGFDYNWEATPGINSCLCSVFTREVIKTLPDGSRHVRNDYGVTELEKDDAGSIPTEIDHLLKDRASWEEFYLPKLQYSDERIETAEFLRVADSMDKENPIGLFVGSLFGVIRNWMGVEGVSYLLADDEELYDEIIATVANLAYKTLEKALEKGAEFDYAHFWEDIAFKNGPLVIPSVFDEKVGPYYKKITDLLKANGVDIVSLDCDGVIDSLIPTWIENGVNTMFPIEVGTWNASIAPWREKYGKEIRGVGGMDKKVFAYDYAAIDAEIERMKPLMALGGFIPCPDHRIAPDAKWENVQYYCDKMQNLK